MLSSTFHQFIDSVSGALRGFEVLPDAPVGGVALGTSPGLAWFTSRFVSERGSMSSR